MGYKKTIIIKVILLLVILSLVVSAQDIDTTRYGEHPVLNETPVWVYIENHTEVPKLFIELTEDELDRFPELRNALQAKINFTPECVIQPGGTMIEQDPVTGETEEIEYDSLYYLF